MAAFARTAPLKPCTQRCVPPATAILVPQPDGHATSTTGHERAPRGASSAQRARRHRAVSHPRSPPRRRRSAKTGRRPGGGPDTATGDGMSLQARWQRQDGAAPPAASQRSRKAARARRCASSRAICRARTSRSVYGETAARTRRFSSTGSSASTSHCTGRAGSKPLRRAKVGGVIGSRRSFARPPVGSRNRRRAG